MNQIVKIETRDFSGASVQTCNARDLHVFLEVSTAFKDWIARRISEYGFEDGKDFCSFLSESQGGRPSKDYHLTLDMAKELSMVERNEKGKQARLYFLECEKRAKAIDPMQVLSDPAAMRGLLLNYTEKVIALEDKVNELAPKAEALDRISASKDALTYTEASKVLGVKRADLVNMLQVKGWHYRHNKSWVAYDKSIKSGLLQYKEAKYTDPDTGMEVVKPYCHLTQKGLTKLAEYAH